MTKGGISILALLMILLVNCQRGHLQQQTNNSNVTSNTGTLNDAALVKLIKTFAEDEGEEGQKAFNQLHSLPRSELINALSRLRNSLPSTDGLQPQIAFVFCYLDEDYRTNAGFVVSTLSKNPKYDHYYADQAASLVARLVKRGDKSLLKDLFGAVQWADGALAEGLGVSFGDELTNATQAFVETLADQPVKVRMKVYDLIDKTDSLSPEELKPVETTLRNINAQSKSHQVAQEILASVVFR